MNRKIVYKIIVFLINTFIKEWRYDFIEKLNYKFYKVFDITSNDWSMWKRENGYVIRMHTPNGYRYHYLLAHRRSEESEL